MDTFAGVSGQSVVAVRIESGDGFDQSDGADRNQIFRIFIQVLVFFNDMSYKTKISFDQDMFRFKVALRIFLQLVSFFCSGERWEKRIQEKHLLA